MVKNRDGIKSTFVGKKTEFFVKSQELYALILIKIFIEIIVASYAIIRNNTVGPLHALSNIPKC